MATKNFAYDDPCYRVHFGVSAEAGGAANTQYNKFVAWTAMQLYSISYTTTVVGTAVLSTLAWFKINTGGTTTNVLATLGTSTVGLNFNFAATSASGGVSLAAGDVIAFVSGTDTTMKEVVTWELGLTPTTGATTV